MVKCKLILISIIALVCLLACGRGNILSKQQLEDMLFEMHFSDGVFNTLAQQNQAQNIDLNLRYKSIFEKYGCSRDRFEKSLREYSRDKETLDKIYANLQERFNEMIKNYEGKTFSEFTQELGNKLFEPFKSIIQPAKENFENIENFTAFIEKIMNIDENDYSDGIKNMEIDSIQQVTPKN